MHCQRGAKAGKYDLAQCRVCWLELNRVPQARGLGDVVAAGLSSLGVTPARVSAITGKPCKCAERKRALNEFGANVANAAASLKDKIGGVFPPKK